MSDQYDGSRVEAEEAGERHELLDRDDHTSAAHPPDPNAGIVRATPPSAGALLLTAAVAAATILALIFFAWQVS